jgi:phospholipid/cholesterol/gamma-HCH transport system substrate-binding protein
MKRKTNTKVRLGIFISLGIVIFLIGIYFIGERQQLFRSTFRVSGIFNDVAGLQAGNNVRFSGMNVGTVDYVNIVSDSSVKVEILIDEGIRKYIKKDAVASIGSEGLMGNKVLIINPGSGGKMEIEDNDTVETIQPIDIDNIMVSLKRTIDNTSNITSDLSKIASNIESGKGTIGRLLMDQDLALTFDSSFVNLKLGSEGLRILMDDSRVSFAQNFDSTFVNLREGSAGFKVLMDKAKKSWLLWGF